MARQLIWFSNTEEPTVESFPKLQLFSVAQDLKMEQRPIKQRYKMLIQDFTRYVQSRKASLKPEEVNLLDQMFILRFNNLVNQVEDDISAGKMVSASLAITDSDIRKAADKFSREYRKLLRARDTLGYIPRTNQEKVDDHYKLMIAELRKKVFAPVLNLFSWDPKDLPESVEPTEEQKKVLESPQVMPLSQLYDLIVGYLRSQNINAKVDITDDNFIKVVINSDKDEKDNPKE